jgi:8-oxo-dGTP diphosphatase
MSLKRKKRPNWLPVVAGILIKDGKTLLGQRPEHKSLPGLWEFPGGKIELNESPEEALRRELDEELGIQADIGELKIATTHTYGEVGVLLLFFEVRFWKGAPSAKHHLEIKWVDKDELVQQKLPDANQIVLPRIVELLD